MPPPDWRQIAREYDERFKKLAEELAFEQDRDRFIETFDLAIQFSKIVRWDPDSVDLGGKTDQSVTFLEHVVEILHRHAMQSDDYISFNWARRAETYNEVHRPKHLARPEHAPIILGFFVEIRAIRQAESGLYRVTGPEMLIKIIESGKAAPDHPVSIRDLTIDVIYLRSFAESLAAQGRTDEAFLCREAARILHQDLQGHIDDESVTAT